MNSYFFRKLPSDVSGQHPYVFHAVEPPAPPLSQGVGMIKFHVK